MNPLHMKRIESIKHVLKNVYCKIELLTLSFNGGTKKAALDRSILLLPDKGRSIYEVTLTLRVDKMKNYRIVIPKKKRFPIPYELVIWTLESESTKKYLLRSNFCVISK